MKVIFISISVIFTLLLRIIIIMSSLHWKSISNFFIYIREFKIVLFCFVMLCYDFADVYRLFSKPAEISCNIFISVKCSSFVCLCLLVYFFLSILNFHFYITMLSIQTDSLFLTKFETSILDTAHYCILYYYFVTQSFCGQTLNGYVT